MNQIKYQLIKIEVAEAGSQPKYSVDMDKMYKKLTGIHASLPEEKALVGTCLSLKIAEKEIFPEDFEIKMISTGLNVSPNDRFYDKINEEALGNHIEGRLRDSGKATSYPYTAKIYLRLEERQ
jgi:hypothetical protein